MLASPCYVISDAHLGAGDVELERRLVAFLRQLPGRAGSLLVNGDLFDFWFEWRTVIPRGHFRTLAALAELVDAGVPVTMLAGNHDCWGGDVLNQEVGIDYRVSGWQGELAGWRTTVEHGDGLRDVEDRPYRRLRTVLRHPWAIHAFRWLHPDLGSRLATRSSGASRDHRARDGGEGLKAVALAHLAAHPTHPAARVRSFARARARARAGRRRVREPRRVDGCAHLPPRDAGARGAAAMARRISRG